MERLIGFLPVGQFKPITVAVADRIETSGISKLAQKKYELSDIRIVTEPGQLSMLFSGTHNWTESPPRKHVPCVREEECRGYGLNALLEETLEVPRLDSQLVTV